MDESVDPVELLLRLLIRHKPHLKPYAYRQDSWQRVLDEYNRQTGSRYRQSRTLKTKFRRLKDLFSADRAQFSPSQLKLMGALLDEAPEHPKPRTKFGNESSSSSSSSSFIKVIRGLIRFNNYHPLNIRITTAPTMSIQAHNRCPWIQ